VSALFQRFLEGLGPELCLGVGPVGSRVAGPAHLLATLGDEVGAQGDVVVMDHRFNDGGFGFQRKTGWKLGGGLGGRAFFPHGGHWLFRSRFLGAWSLCDGGFLGGSHGVYSL
jgi:hypothetical protein